MEASYKIPFYGKVALIFISVFAMIFTMLVGQRIIVPILYATIIAILLNPSSASVRLPSIRYV